jgi:hypothetical protein
MPFRVSLNLFVAICYGHLDCTYVMRGTGEVSRTLKVLHSSYSSILKRVESNHLKGSDACRCAFRRTADRRPHKFRQFQCQSGPNGTERMELDGWLGTGVPKQERLMIDGIVMAQSL